MEGFRKKVEQMQISFDILNGYNGHVEERHKALEKRLQSNFEKCEKVKLMLEEYEEHLEHQKVIEKHFLDLKKKLVYIQKYFPRGLIVRCDEDDESPAVCGQTNQLKCPSPRGNSEETWNSLKTKLQQELKNKTVGTPNSKINKPTAPGSMKKVLTDRSNIKINVIQPESLFFSAKKEEPLKKDRIAQDISVSYVVEEEFSLVSSYMKGRLSLSAINEFIDFFNATLNKKYDLLKKPKKLKSKAELQQCLTWSEQEIGELIGNYFCTGEDFDKLSAIKIGNKKYINIITILRHLKRMKEVRIMKAIYYVACF